MYARINRFASPIFDRKMVANAPAWLKMRVGAQRGQRGTDEFHYKPTPVMQWNTKNT